VTCLLCPLCDSGLLNTATDINSTNEDIVRGSVLYAVHAEVIYQEPLGKISCEGVSSQ
jgi:hypothetical protein